MTAYASLNRVRTETVSLYCATCHQRLDLTHQQRIGLPSCSEACAAPLREAWLMVTRKIAVLRPLVGREELLAAAQDALLDERRCAYG